MKTSNFTSTVAYLHAIKLFEQAFSRAITTCLNVLGVEDIKTPHVEMLLLVADMGEESTNAAIKKAYGKNQVTLTKYLSVLTEQGYITAHHTPANRHITLWTLTAKGRSLYEAIEAAFNEGTKTHIVLQPEKSVQEMKAAAATLVTVGGYMGVKRSKATARPPATLNTRENS